MVYRFTNGYQDRLPAKQVEFAREIVPSASKTGLLTNLKDPKAPPQAQEIVSAARTLEVKTVSADANLPEDIDSALRFLAGEHVDVVIVLQTSLLLSYAQQIATSA